MRYRLWSCLFAALLVCIASEANAGRFGGGKSIGTSRSYSSSYSAPSRSYRSSNSSRSYTSPSRSNNTYSFNRSANSSAMNTPPPANNRFGGNKNSGIQRSYNSTAPSNTLSSARSPSNGSGSTPTQGRLVSAPPTANATAAPQPAPARPASPSAIPGYAPRPVAAPPLVAARPVAPVVQQSSSWWRPATAFLAGLGLGALLGHHQDSVAAVSNTGAGLSGAGSGTGGAAATALPGTTTAPVEHAAASGGFWHSIALFCLWAIVLFLSYKVLRLIFYRPSPVMAQPAPMRAASPSATTAPSPAPAAENAFSGPAPGNIPSDFPKDDFERAVESSFIRLQAANDRGDLDDIREYTTPEIFAEISLQLQERGNVQQHTDVLRVAATLLEVVTEGHFEIASVLMQGTLRENHGAETDFREVWHIRQDRRSQDAPWLLAGIQQV